jgi:nucleotide-binding universal stress UspA family protein
MTSEQTSSTEVHRILLGVDGSEHSLAAAQLLASLPCAHNCLVRTVGVLLPRQAHNHAYLENALQEVEGILAAQGLQVHSDLLTGNAAEQLVAYADDWQPDLMLLGAKGLRSTLGILLGGVAQQVVEYARWPVLVVRAPFTGVQRVLLISDGSAAAEQAVAFTTRFELPAGADIRLAHVLPPMPTPELIPQAWALDLQSGGGLASGELMASLERQAELEEEEGQQILDGTTRTLQAAGLQPTQVLLRGDAASEILEYARAQQIDLIIAGSRGLGQVRGWLLGSVSRKLLHYARCSVLVVRQPEGGHTN